MLCSDIGNNFGNIEGRYKQLYKHISCTLFGMISKTVLSKQKYDSPHWYFKTNERKLSNKVTGLISKYVPKIN